MTKEQMLDTLINKLGFENEIVIEFATLCESEEFTDETLKMIYEDIIQ